MGRFTRSGLPRWHEPCGTGAAIPSAVLSGQPPVVQPWVKEVLAAALRDAGCPSSIAQQLSSKVRIERPEGSTEWLLMLTNYGTSYPADRDELTGAAEYLATNVAADNAEAVDRAA